MRGKRKLLGREAGLSVEMVHVGKWTAETAHNKKCRRRAGSVCPPQGMVAGGSAITPRSHTPQGGKDGCFGILGPKKPLPKGPW